jgi:hypothetical protein
LVLSGWVFLQASKQNEIEREKVNCPPKRRNYTLAIFFDEANHQKKHFTGSAWREPDLSLHRSTNIPLNTPPYAT